MTETKGLNVDVRRNKMAAVFRKRASDLATRKIEKSKKQKDIPILAFWIKNECYAVTLEDLSGVLPFGNCTPVPKSDGMICGIINILGELHSVVELSALMGLAPPQQDEKGYILVLKSYQVGLRVHRVDRILRFQEKDQTVLDTEKHKLSTQYGRGLFRDNIVWLDIHKLINNGLLSKQQNNF